MVRPLAIETTRFDSICVRCILVVVEEGVCVGTMWDFAFSVAAFPAPRCRVSKLDSRPPHTQFPTSIPSPTSHLPPHRRMKMGGQFALLDFPVEIICHILSFTSYRDLVHSALVCHSKPPQAYNPTNAFAYPCDADVQVHEKYSTEIGSLVLPHRPRLP